MTIDLIIYVGQRLSKNRVLYRHVCIVFLPNPPIAILELPHCSSRAWLTKTLLLVSQARIQCARDDEGPYFCINQNNNINNDLHCSSNEFPNHLALLTMMQFK